MISYLYVFFIFEQTIVEVLCRLAFINVRNNTLEINSLLWLYPNKSTNKLPWFHPIILKSNSIFSLKYIFHFGIKFNFCKNIIKFVRYVRPVCYKLFGLCFIFISYGTQFTEEGGEGLFFRFDNMLSLYFLIQSSSQSDCFVF